MTQELRKSSWLRLQRHVPKWLWQITGMCLLAGGVFGVLVIIHTRQEGVVQQQNMTVAQLYAERDRELARERASLEWANKTLDHMEEKAADDQARRHRQAADVLQAQIDAMQDQHMAQQDDRITRLEQHPFGGAKGLNWLFGVFERMGMARWTRVKTYVAENYVPQAGFDQRVEQVLQKHGLLDGPRSLPQPRDVDVQDIMLSMRPREAHGTAASLPSPQLTRIQLAPSGVLAILLVSLALAWSATNPLRPGESGTDMEKRRFVLPDDMRWFTICVLACVMTVGALFALAHFGVMIMPPVV